jgi:hypothetical protein
VHSTQPSEKDDVIKSTLLASLESACNQQLRPFSPLLQESIVPSVKAVALPLLTVKQWPA